MKRMEMKGKPAIKVAIVLFPFLFSTTTAVAADNSYVPHAGGFWNVPGNWSQGSVPNANDDVRVVVSGGSHKAVDYNWTGSTAFDDMTIDGGTSGQYGAIWQLQGEILANEMFLGNVGEAWHWMESDALLWLLDDLYVGYQDPGPGHFYMACTSNGLIVNDNSYVGYSGPGDFDHIMGTHICNHLFVGQSDQGTYWLKGSEESSILEPQYYIIVGNGDVGLFEQTGGHVNNMDAFLGIGLNPGGEGTYNMKGGTVDIDRISIGYAGDGYFNHTGGVVNTDGNVNIGVYDAQPHRAWYKISDTDGDPELNIGGDLNIGEISLAKFEQNSGGTTTVDGNIEIWEGAPGDYSYLYLGLNADWIEAAQVINHSGYYDQDGGTMSTPSLTNDSTYGINIDNNADLRATNVTNNAGTFWMWRNAELRGEYAGGGMYFMCNFTNNATFQMGNASFNGGTFTGHLTNHGTFNYYQGDFSDSTLTNYGTFNCNNPFTCNRLVQNAYAYNVTTSAPITAYGSGYANAFENNANLTIQSGAAVTVVNSPLVNNDNFYAGGTVNGDVVNNDYLNPGVGTSAHGELYIDGDFTQSSSGFFRSRIGGTMPVTEFDRIRITGHATLAGTLQVLLTDEFTPELGDSFRVMIANGGYTGQFTNESLPALPAGLEWEVIYTSIHVQLNVVEEGDPCPADLTGDDQVNIDDIFAVLGLWGPCPPPCPPYCIGDLTEDCSVNIDDIFAILGQWGLCD